MLRKAALLTVLLLALGGGFGTKTADASSTKVHVAQTNIQQAKSALRWITLHKALYRNSRVYHRVIVVQRKKYFHWRHVLSVLSVSRLPPHYSAWMCIHKFEGSWKDHGAPYYGGLQMDWDFMRAYGRRLLRTKGTADNWTPLEQMWVAEAAYRAGRGFYPWPNTARMCGLI